ncbi:uncharacterized protein L3040_004141 [Drepanopeziza brunnea f. sp. 'multigermtubi']|uniref:Putative reticulocyte-binding protein 2 n=1 Tax=Marssonina brunnea f. sp. multigermtubi (strain MB_m1) TaxID=1072389 RepID=K1WYI0_MARBU|nr:putative reticulocyte-binding protein 2 [Drepanopeziza brunnea f. sp. 'multigermtubi' MB_m1]EKD13648.1 putative reticulocyte-binding protein 2 [Drepanopeziza brunnea f. sp. 'multigermtubi' MB_m1]KAJ5042744.1 hypothetical protein L3040_004141 [Drepanopeziza brunnea f. sp. 'multigermtubi']
MAALHDALKSLGPLDISDISLDDLKPFLSHTFSKGQLLVDSVPIPAASGDPSPQGGRSPASPWASSAAEITSSSARPTPPPPDVEVLQKQWKQVKINPRDNPLGMSVYKASGNDGRGAWFARRSVHEGLGFTRWKRALEREFPETMKVQGGPGEGNIRGIGGEKRVEYKNVEGVGKMEVYLVSAQFPGPTTPRDFVTMFMSSDQALSDRSGGEQDVPRHFMVISRPCSHPATPPRDGFIRGQYESIEFIREIPIYKVPTKSASTSNLPSIRGRASSKHSKDVIMRDANNTNPPPNGGDGGSETEEAAPSKNGRLRGATISVDGSRGSDANGEDMDVARKDDESECNPIEWIMITRSDPGGSVPRFMVERGTPGGIVSDASKFLDWACGKDIEGLESDDELGSIGEASQEESALTHEHKPKDDHEGKLYNYQTNGHLAGIEEASTPADKNPRDHSNGGLDGINVSPEKSTETPRQYSVSSISSVSSAGSFASALENYDSDEASSSKSTDSFARVRAVALSDKELQKLDEKKRKLDEKFAKNQQKELDKKSEDSAKEGVANKKAGDKHEKEKRKQEEKYQKEVDKLQRRKQKEERKAEDRRKKAAEKDSKARLLRELEEIKAEAAFLRKERDILKGQVGDLQAENTTLVAKIGKLGPQGEDALKDMRGEFRRRSTARASSFKGPIRSSTFRSAESNETTSDKLRTT